MTSDERVLDLLPRLADGHFAVVKQTCADLLAADVSGAEIVPLLVRSMEAGGALRKDATLYCERLARYADESFAGDPPFLATLRGRTVPSLLAAAKDDAWYARTMALNTLGLLGRDDNAILDALVAGLSDAHDSVRQSACLGIAAWGKAGAPAVSALIPLVASAVDEYACDALRAIGPAAAEAIPALKRHARAGDDSGRDHAKQALKAIEPAAPKKPARAKADPSDGDRATKTWAIGKRRGLELDGERSERIAFAPSGDVFASAGSDPRAHVRRIVDGSVVATFQHDGGSYGGHVTSLAFGSEGRHLVTTSVDGKIRFFGVDDGALLATSRFFAENHGRTRSVVAPDGKTVAFLSSEGIVFFDLEARKQRTIKLRDASYAPTYTLAFSTNSASLLCWGESGGAVLDVASGKETAWCPKMGPRMCAAAIGDAEGRFRLVSSSKRKEIFIDDPLTGARLVTFAAATKGPHAFAFDKAGVTVAAGSGAKVQWIHLTDGRELACVSSPSAYIGDLAISADGTLLAAADSNHGALFWSLSRGH